MQKYTPERVLFADSVGTDDSKIVPYTTFYIQKISHVKPQIYKVQVML